MLGFRVLNGNPAGDCRATLDDPEQMRRMMAPESLQAMMSMAQQLEQMGLSPGMQGGAGMVSFSLPC